jgi:protocatechuate 4,5-dioxygenase beta chain
VTAPAEKWPAIYERLIKGVPQPPEAAEETAEVITDYVGRIGDSFTTLKDKLKEYGAELLIIIGGDQTEMFDRSNVPNLMIYTGDVAWGHNNNGLAGEEPSEADIVRLKVDVQTSQTILKRLVREEGFDVSFSGEQGSLGRPGKGLPHAFARPAPLLTPDFDIPVIIFYENTFDSPSLSAERCYKLGRALARLLADDPRKIAIYGSGGLSHDPGGPRSGWVDEPLDRWFLDQIEKGNGQGTTSLYRFDSMTMRGGTGELRAWITVAGAMEEMGSKGAKVIDYIPANHAVTGLGWAYWPELSLVTA